MSDDFDAEWRPRQRRNLGCPVSRVGYDHKTRSVHLWLPRACCVDMGGAIEFSTERFPEALTIITYSGALLDTCYVRPGVGRAWVAHQSAAKDIIYAMRTPHARE